MLTNITFMIFSINLHTISFLILTVYIFLTFAMYLLLNVFDVRYIKNLSDLKKIGSVFPFNILFLILILSFAGIPPLFGFTIKMLIFISLIKSTAPIYITLLALFNFFTLYFYVQNVRYVVNNSPNNYYTYAQYFAILSESSLFVLFGILLVNIAGILCIADLVNLITLMNL